MDGFHDLGGFQGFGRVPHTIPTTFLSNDASLPCRTTARLLLPIGETCCKYVPPARLFTHCASRSTAHVCSASGPSSLKGGPV